MVGLPDKNIEDISANPLPRCCVWATSAQTLKCPWKLATGNKLRWTEYSLDTNTEPHSSDFRNRNQFTLNSVTDLYSLATILSFIVPKSMGCFIIIEYPGAIASVTGKAKNP